MREKEKVRFFKIGDLQLFKMSIILFKNEKTLQLNELYGRLLVCLNCFPKFYVMALFQILISKNPPFTFWNFCTVIHN